MSCRHEEGDPKCTTKNPEEMRKRARAMSAKWDPPTHPAVEDYEWVWNLNDKTFSRRNAIVHAPNGMNSPSQWTTYSPPMTGEAPTQWDAMYAADQVDGWVAHCRYCGEVDDDGEMHMYCSEIWTAPGQLRDPDWRGNPPLNPDATDFDIQCAEQVGEYLLVEVQYPSCANCSYEGVKLLVFSGVTKDDALRWKEVDPHFRDPAAIPNPRKAPSPVARFPASAQGWAHARKFAG